MILKPALILLCKVQLKLPVSGHVRISGAVSSENENIVDGCIRPVRLFSYVQSGHGLIVHHDFQFKTLTVGHAKLFGNPSIDSFGYLIDPRAGVLVPRAWLTIPAGNQFDFYRLK